MKNFKLLLGAAVVFAVGSAFTASNKAVAGEYVYDSENSTFVLKSALPGHCEDMPSEVCDYTKTNPGGDNQNPANFTENRTNAEWVID